VHTGENRCSTPAPAPSPDVLCPDEAIPAEWLSSCLAGDLLYSASATEGLWPEVGNGFVATVVQSGTIYAAGLFNGPDTDNTQRARIPGIDVAPPNRGAISDQFRGGRGLALDSAVFTQISAATSTVRSIERWYAPAQEPSLIVHEIEFTNFGQQNETIDLQTTYPVGGESADLDLSVVANSSGVLLIAGANKVAATSSEELTDVAFAANTLPSNIVVPGGNGSVTLYSLTRWVQFCW